MLVADEDTWAVGTCTGSGLFRGCWDGVLYVYVITGGVYSEGYEYGNELTGGSYGASGLCWAINVSLKLIYTRLGSLPQQRSF